MAKGRIALLGTAMFSAALLAGAAKAQDYYGGPHDGQAYYDGYRDAPETVIVHPYDRVEKRRVLGRVNGEIDPTEFSLSRPVSFSDLDLSRPDDRAELRIRVHETALDLCAELDAHIPQLRGDRDADRECVREAARSAMRDVMDRYG